VVVSAFAVRLAVTTLGPEMADSTAVFCTIGFRQYFPMTGRTASDDHHRSPDSNRAILRLALIP